LIVKISDYPVTALEEGVCWIIEGVTKRPNHPVTCKYK
jgi:hypothetical protein